MNTFEALEEQKSPQPKEKLEKGKKEEISPERKEVVRKIAYQDCEDYLKGIFAIRGIKVALGHNIDPFKADLDDNVKYACEREKGKFNRILEDESSIYKTAFKERYKMGYLLPTDPKDMN